MQHTKENAPTNKGKGAKVSKHKHFSKTWLFVLREAVFIFAVVAMVAMAAWGVKS
jgi:hypothetical protein